MTLDDLDYELPAGRIAQEPTRPRDASRLLAVEREGDGLTEHVFADLPGLLGPHDLLVVNDTRVIPAKLRGSKLSGGRVEALLIERLADGSFRAMLRASGRLRAGVALRFGGAVAEVRTVEPGGSVRLHFDDADVDALLDEIGEAPLPPYIERAEPDASDRVRYQSVFARVPGAVAAPTASLHFTKELVARLRIVPITLHVGPGTFRPIRGEPDLHRVDAERFSVPSETARAIAAARADGGRVVAVGTTVARALETTGGAPGEGSTDLFIRPGYVFEAVDGLVTNFHLPRSSLIALVMAFAGVSRIRRAYQFAIDKGFRFYSYGDAMWIV